MSSTDRDWKLRLVVCSDLTTGQKLAQTNHALAEFATEYPEQFMLWHTISNSIIILQSPSIEELLLRADKLGIKYSIFREPDLDGRLTAACFEASINSRRLTSSLKLAS